jgi:hypothetical protein
MSSSGARKDMSGFTMDFSTQERRPVVFLGSTGSTAYNNAVMIYKCYYSSILNN